MITRDRSGLYVDRGRKGAPSAVQISDRFHLVSNLSEAVARDIQQLLIDARKHLAQSEAAEPAETNKLTLIQARRQKDAGTHATSDICRCRNYAGMVRLNYKLRRRLASRQTPWPETM